MKNLLYKELKLVLHPSVYFLFACVMILLIPGYYPYILAFSYVLICFINTFLTARANNDLKFTAMLPVSRKDIVLGKHMLAWFIEIVELLIAIPFAIISSYLISPNGNPLGLDANITLFAVVILGYAVFNIIFLPGFFKTGYKSGMPLLFAFSGYFLVYGIAETLIAVVPSIRLNFDSSSPDTILYRLIFLLVSIAIYIIFNIISLKKSVLNFNKVSL
ncbi:MAG: ABC-2 transporter permease [Clostridia bacterium]|jgi:hypothetical protein|nr:ABC-2 transporter permease [Clostridia bacterium]